jgi:hypothetical protein
MAYPRLRFYGSSRPNRARVFPYEQSYKKLYLIENIFDSFLCEEYDTSSSRVETKAASPCVARRRRRGARTPGMSKPPCPSWRAAAPLAAAATGGYGRAERLSPWAESLGGLAVPPWDSRHTGARACNHRVLIVISPICPYCASS